jgi:hypothetical protein
MQTSVSDFTATKRVHRQTARIKSALLSLNEPIHQLTELSISDNLVVWRSLGTMASTACLTFMAR